MHLENQHSLREVLAGMVDDLKWKEKLHETKVKEVWKEKMGTTINHFTKEISFRKGKLFINIESSSVKQDMSYEREKIREMMNRELCGEFVKEVIIR